MSRSVRTSFGRALRLAPLLLTTLAPGAVGPLWAAEIVVPLPPSPVDVDRDASGFARFEGQGLEVPAASGAPAVPTQAVHVLLPPDADLATVSAFVETPRYRELPGVWRVRPVPPIMHWDGERHRPRWPPDRRIIEGRDVEIYGSASPWPASVRGEVGTGRLRKWKLAHVTVAPYRFRPATGTLERLDGGTLVFQYERQAREDPLLADPRARADRVGEERLRDLVANYEEMAGAYAAVPAAGRSRAAPGLTVTPAPAPPPEGPEGYVVITTRHVVERSRQFPAFVASKRLRGFNVWVVTEEQWGGGVGDAAAENIRAWLRANHLALHIRYVLLIGDPQSHTDAWGGSIDGDVPMKMLFPENASNPDFPPPTDRHLVPSDYYYADLSGDWDLDGDGHFGERVLYVHGLPWDHGDFGPGGVDPYSDVVVGRLPFYGDTGVPQPVEVLDRILAKIVRYESQTTAESAWRHNALLVMARSDALTTGHELGEEIKDRVIVPRGDFGYHRVYEESYGLNPPPETTPITLETWTRAWTSAPFGAVFWWAHGNGRAVFGWEPVTGEEEDPGRQYVIMDLPHVQQLDDRHPSFTFQASCGNSHPEFDDNLSFSLLQNGGIGTIGATRCSNYLPGGGPYGDNWTNAGMNYKYAERLIGDEMPSGDALHDLRIAVPEYSHWWPNRVAFNLYGDPSLGLFTTREPLPAGGYRLRARVFVDESCDGRFTRGEDRPLEGVGVSLRLPDGAHDLRWTNDRGRVGFSGFSVGDPVRLDAAIPPVDGGFALEMCPGSPRSVELGPDDFGRWNRAAVQFRARPVPLDAERLTVDFQTAVVNGTPLDGANPTIEVEPGERLTGYLDVAVDNRQPGHYITPVIGTASWGRDLTGRDEGWYRPLSSWAPAGRSAHRLEIDLTAPLTPGVHHVGVFAGWMYAPAEVAAGDHPPVFGDGDDAWDMDPDGWQEVLEEGHASSGPYRMPGRGLRVVVRAAPSEPPDEYLQVDVTRAEVNHRQLVPDAPVYVAMPGEILGGVLEVEVDNEQFANSLYYITPVIGTASWGRSLTGADEGWYQVLTERADEGRTTQTFRFALAAPAVPGTYYLGAFAGWMYQGREVAANGHPFVFGDGDDVWDMPARGWEEVIDQGAALSGPYHLPGRAIKIVVPDTRRPYISSITFQPVRVELGQRVRATVTMVNPLPYGTLGRIKLDVDRDRLPPGGPYEHSMAGWVWMPAGRHGIRFSRWILPRELGRYSRQARLRYLDRRGWQWRTSDFWSWGHAFTVGAQPFIKAIIPLHHRLHLGQEQRIFVHVANPDGKKRNLQVELAVSPSPMGVPRFVHRARADLKRPHHAVAAFPNPGAPYDVGRYDVAARLVRYASRKGPMFGFEVLGPEVTLGDPEDEVVPAVAVRVDTPNGGETWGYYRTHEVTWTRDDGGDALVVGVAASNGTEVAQKVGVRLLVARSPGGPAVHEAAWNGVIDPGGVEPVSFRFEPRTAWGGVGPKAEDHYYQLWVEQDGQVLDQTAWRGPHSLRKAGAIVEKTSVHIFYDGAHHSTWEDKSPNTDVYFPDGTSPSGVSYGWILPEFYAPTMHARAVVELFDAGDDRVAVDDSDADFTIGGGPTVN